MEELGSRNLDVQAVFPLSTYIWLAKDSKQQAPHVGGSITI